MKPQAFFGHVAGHDFHIGWIFFLMGFKGWQDSKRAMICEKKEQF